MIHLDIIHKSFLPSTRLRWYKNNKLHNNNGPALLVTDGYTEWRVNGLLHNTNGPAVIYSTDNTELSIAEVLQRTISFDGNSLEGNKKWYIHGQVIDSELEFWIAVNKLQINT